MDKHKPIRVDPSRVTIEPSLPPDVERRFRECLDNAMIDFAYMAFGIQSPSRKWANAAREWGEGFTRGFAEGVARANAIDVWPIPDSANALAIIRKVE